jgi:trk system potassium uptake protein TrkA
MRQIGVIGLGRFGIALARRLTEKGIEVTAIDADQQRVEEIKDAVAVAVVLDSTDEPALEEIGLAEMDAVIVCIGDNVEANLLTTMLLKKLGVRMIYSRSMDPLQARLLELAGVTRVIRLEEEMAINIADSMVATNIQKVVPLASGHAIAEVTAPESFVGKTLQDLGVRRRFGVNVAAIKRKTPAIDDAGRRVFRETINDVPQGEDVVEEGDVLVVVGRDDSIEKLSQA